MLRLVSLRTAVLLLSAPAGSALATLPAPLAARASAPLVRAFSTLQAHGGFDYGGFEYNGRKSAEARWAARRAKAEGTEALEQTIEQPRIVEADVSQQSDKAAEAAEFYAEEATVQLAIEAAAAAAAQVLLYDDGEVANAAVSRVIAGFPAQLWEILPLQSVGGSARPSNPARVPTPGDAAMRDPLSASDKALTKESLTRVLTEFVETDYARRLCDDAGVQPLIGSPSRLRIGIIFESVRLDETRLSVRLHRVFEQRSERLLEQLVKHLRAQMPELERLLFEAKSPPSTRTFILRK